MKINRIYFYVAVYSDLHYSDNEHSDTINEAINNKIDELGIVPDNIISISETFDKEDRSYGIVIYYKGL